MHWILVTALWNFAVLVAAAIAAPASVLESAGSDFAWSEIAGPALNTLLLAAWIPIAGIIIALALECDTDAPTDLAGEEISLD